MRTKSTLLLLAGLGLGHVVSAQTFNQDVAPIIYSKCTSCHNPNGVNSQVPFTSYNEVADYSGSIESQISNGLMPPWPADTTYTKFIGQHQKTLTAVEKNKILQWITKGTPKGTGTEPVAPTFAESNKLKGKADLVVGTGLVKSNASPSNLNPYNCFIVPTGLTEDRWLRAVEIVPGNLKVVHHVVVTVDTTGSFNSTVDGSCASQPGQFGIAGWSSGAGPVVYPSQAPLKLGQRIPKNSYVVIQMHYAPGSDGLLDSSKVRLYFYDKTDLAGMREVKEEVALQYWGLGLGGSNPTSIPANQGVWVTANPGSINPGAASGGSLFLNDPQAGNTDISVISVNPHSHLVCTKIKNYAFKGTDTIPLISIPNWKYHWQGYYYFPKPVKIPYTHKLQSKHFYDNRSTNPGVAEAGMNPNNPVAFATGTQDEMLFDAVTYMKYQTGDENIDLEAIAASDPIFSDGTEPKPYEEALFVETALTVGIEAIDEEGNFIVISPNPANDLVNVVLSKVAAYSGRIMNITGQTVVNIPNFSDRVTVDLQNLSEGVYILEVTNVKTGESITKKVIKTN